MYYLSYKETGLRYVYNSTLKHILTKQHLMIQNPFLVKLPTIKFYFYFKDITELNILKLYNNLTLIWLFSANLLRVKKFANRFERGIRYFRFFFECSLNSANKKIFDILDFLANKLFFFIEQRFLYKSSTQESCFFKFGALDYFSNIRLSGSFYTSNVNDALYLLIDSNMSSLVEASKFITYFKLA